jgi:hypothetical protein
MLRRVALVRADVSEELSAPFIRVTRIGELGTMLAVTSNRRTLRRNTKCHHDDGGDKFIRNFGSYKSHISIHLIGSGTPDRPACSVASQPATLLRTSTWVQCAWTGQ